MKRGSKHTEEARQKNREKHLGKSPANKGKTNIELFGEEKAKEVSTKISKAKKGKSNLYLKGKTWEKKLGEERAKIAKKRLSESKRGKTTYRKGLSMIKEYGEEKAKLLKEHHSLVMKGRKNTKKSNKKRRLARIKQLKQNGFSFPSYNKQACEFFKSFDERNNIQGRYAMYGGGEYFIKGLGYWIDYINFGLKLIIEWDEKSHYNSNGILKEKDVIRQKEIQKHFPSFEFRRIKQSPGYKEEII